MTSPAMTPARERSRTSLYATAGAAIVPPIVALATAEAGLRDVETAPSTIDYVFITLLLVASAAILGLLAPRLLRIDEPRRLTRISIGLAIGAWVTGVVFWTMLPVLVGGTAAVVGAHARRHGAGAGATIAIVVGLAAAVVTVLAYVTGSM